MGITTWGSECLLDKARYTWISFESDSEPLVTSITLKAVYNSRSLKIAASPIVLVSSSGDRPSWFRLNIALLLSSRSTVATSLNNAAPIIGV